MTRGRHANHAFVVTDADRTARDILDGALAQNWIDVPALVRQVELARPTDRPVDRRGLQPRSSHELRQLLEAEQHFLGRINEHDELVRRTPDQLARTQQDHARALSDLADAERCEDHGHYNCDECTEAAPAVVYLVAGSHPDDSPYAPRAAFEVTL